MTPPKKPGTDLSALKARLAKKNAGEEAAAPAAPAPAAPKAAPPADIPAPGQKAAPPPPAAAPMDIPAPGEVAAPKPAADIPAPGEVRRPAPAPAPAAPAQPGPAGQAFGGGGGGFDPNEGLIADVGGDIPTKGNKGIVIIAALGALVFGIGLGWMLNNISSKGKLVATGKEKGAVMLKEVQDVAEMRKSISLKMEDIAKKMAADPKGGAADLKALSDANFEKHPKIDNLFGWQLAAVHKAGIQKTFELYEEANGLKTDLSYLSTFATAYADALKEGSGPRLFAVKFTKDKAVVVARTKAICGEAECEGGKESGATALGIIETVGGDETVLPIGSGDGQVMPIDPSGQMYGYIVGLKPENNASAVYASLLKRVMERLEAMNAAEGKALKALKNYSDDPDVDGSGQPEPGE